MNNYDVFQKIAEQEMPYLSQWYLEHPVVVTTKRYDGLKKVQSLLYRAILYFVENYKKYGDLFPVSAAVERILEICSAFPYRVGTYRPDFLINSQGDLKICEIGARFPLNGYFISGISEAIGENLFACAPAVGRKRQSETFLDYLSEYFGDFSELCVLKGADKPCDIKYYTQYFDQLGVRVRVVTPQDLDQNLDRLGGCAVVNEFNQMEIETFSDQAILAIAASNSLNDLRTIFLIHDKRFLSVLSRQNFLEEFLSRSDARYLLNYLIPTFSYRQDQESWDLAKTQKDQWVIKHALLGKSEKVFAGCVTTPGQWQELFDSQAIREMVLQPFVVQKQVLSHIGDVAYQDYAVGTLLCFDNEFFGPGIFRTSSFAITNRVDDRKMCQWRTDEYSGRNVVLL